MVAGETATAPSRSRLCLLPMFRHSDQSRDRQGAVPGPCCSIVQFGTGLGTGLGRVWDGGTACRGGMGIIPVDFGLFFRDPVRHGPQAVPHLASHFPIMAEATSSQPASAPEQAVT